MSQTSNPESLEGLAVPSEYFPIQRSASPTPLRNIPFFLFFCIYSSPLNIFLFFYSQPKSLSTKTRE